MCAGLTPAKALRLRLYRKGGERLAEAVTDAEGVARIEAGYLRGEGDNAPFSASTPAGAGR